MGKLFEQNIDHAVARPNGQQQPRALPRRALFAAFLFPQQAGKRGKGQYQTDQPPFAQFFAEQCKRRQHGQKQRQPLRRVGFDDARRVHRPPHGDEHRGQQHTQRGKQPPGRQVLPPVGGVGLQKPDGEADGGNVVDADGLADVDFLFARHFQQDGHGDAATDADDEIVHVFS